MNGQLAELVARFGGGFVPATPPPYDLRSLCRALGRVPQDLPDLPPRTWVRVRPGGEPRRIEAPPAQIFGVIDGIQPPARAAAWRNGRPIGLIYAAAGCLGLAEGRMAAYAERLLLVVGRQDEDFTVSISPGIPVVALDQRHAPDLVRAITDFHRALRYQLERDVLAEMRALGKLTVVDGHLRGISPGPTAVASVVKSHPLQLVTDESELESLPVGHLSGPFKILAAFEDEVDRWSA